METPSLIIPISMGVIGLMAIIIAILVIVVIRVVKQKAELKHCDDNNEAIRGYHDFLPTQPDVEQTQATGSIQEGDNNYYNTIEEDGLQFRIIPSMGLSLW